jgi:hypothetical protein
MIEKLHIRRDPDVRILDLSFKVNEIIEAVQELDEVLLPMLEKVDMTAARLGDLQSAVINLSEVKSPGLRPLHIEDGQVQESSAFGYDQNLDEAKAYTAALLKPLSVPEAEPPEQESSLHAAIEDYAGAIRYQERHPDKAALLRVAETYNALIAAAHGEYAQPLIGRMWSDLGKLPDLSPSLDLPAAWVAARALVREQSEDLGLWFLAQYASEAYLQAALRQLHAIVEGQPSAQPGKGV